MEREKEKRRFRGRSLMNLTKKEEEFLRKTSEGKFKDAWKVKVVGCWGLGVLFGWDVYSDVQTVSKRRRIKGTDISGVAKCPIILKDKGEGNEKTSRLRNELVIRDIHCGQKSNQRSSDSKAGALALSQSCKPKIFL